MPIFFSYVLNSLSRTRAISQPVLISPTLIRFSISQYAPRQDEFTAWYQAWEKLADADPYFHLQTEVLADAAGAGHKPTATAPSSGEHIKPNSLKGGASATAWISIKNKPILPHTNTSSASHRLSHFK